MNRRRFAVSLLGLASGLTGCTTRLPLGNDGDPEKPVSLRVRNYFEKRRIASVEITGVRSNRHYKSNFYLFPKWVANRRNILEAGPYDVSVQIDNGMWREATWRMHGCETNVILIDIGPDGVGITSTCQQD